MNSAATHILRSPTRSGRLMRFVGVCSAFICASIGFGAPAAHAAFPGSNGRVAFVSDRDGNKEIYTMNPDGTDQRRLTSNSTLDESPVVSPDGRRIAFTSLRNGNLEVYAMNADGTGQTNVSNSPGADLKPAFSPDGRIAFVSTRDSGNLEIYAMNADGTGQTRLTTDAGFDDSPTFSPDGRRISFSSTRASGDHEIYTMATDGSDVRRLTSTSYADFSPSYSPDGAKIAFTSDRNGTDNEIWVMDVNGAGQTPLTASAGDDAFPSFSPDGRQIAFESKRDGNYEIYVTDGLGSAQRLTNSTGADTEPDWASGPGKSAPALSLGRLTFNKRTGTATLQVTVSDAGVVALSGRGVVAQSAKLAGPSTKGMTVRPSGKAKRRLSHTGKARVPLTVTYTAEIGNPISKSVSVKLIRTRRKH
jgi:Tol biopolymer transport system component